MSDNRSASSRLKDAVKNGDLAEIQQIVDQEGGGSGAGGSGAGSKLLEEKGRMGATILLQAIRHGQLDVVKLLIESSEWNVNVKAKDWRGNTALLVASKCPNPEILKYLLHKGIGDVDAPNANGDTPLLRAASGGEDTVEHVKILVESGRANVEFKDEKGRTPLLVAVESGCAQAVQYFVESAAANTEATMPAGGNTALLEAVTHHHLSVVQILVESSRVNVAASNADGNTALLLAIVEKKLDMIQYLVECGRMNVGAKNGAGNSAFILAVLSMELPVVEYLVGHGHVQTATAVNETTGFTVLHVACEMKQLKMVRYFIETMHMNVLVRNANNGESVLHAALREIDNPEYDEDMWPRQPRTFGPNWEMLLYLVTCLPTNMEVSSWS